MHRKIRLGSGFAAGVLDEQGRLGKIFRSGRLVGLDCKEMRVSPFHVITGLVPVIPIRGALFLIEMAGTSPAMTGGCHPWRAGCQGRGFTTPAWR
ncbi:hypothetical protein J4G37_17505 [Microvirga sp. 3-52]|nr:hypothetical protein [Microvirga sp. 3-52]